MADGNEVIRYVIEVDTSSGKAAIREMLESGEAGGGKGGAAGAAGAGSQGFDSAAMAKIGADQVSLLGDILKAIQGMATDIEGATDDDDAEDEDKTFDLFKNVGNRVKAAGLGLAFAQTPGQHFAVAGALLPGKVGEVVTAFGVLTDKTIGLALSIADFNGELFMAKTQWELFWMGWKIELAEGTSEAFAGLMAQAEALAEEALPYVIAGLNILADVLSVVTWAFRMVIKALTFFVEAVQWVIDSLIILITEILTLGFADTEDWSPTEDLIGGIGDLVDSLNENTNELRLAKKGHELMLGLHTAMDIFGRAKPTDVAFQGMQNAEGQPLDPTEPPAKVRDRMAALRHSEGQGGTATANAFPRPTPAAVDFRVTDQINVQAGDEQMMVNEMLNLKDQVLMMVQGIHDARWARMREARALTMGAHFGVMGA